MNSLSLTAVIVDLCRQGRPPSAFKPGRLLSSEGGSKPASRPRRQAKYSRHRQPRRCLFMITDPSKASRTGEHDHRLPVQGGSG
jgi:hypothetical protein